MRLHHLAAICSIVMITTFSSVIAQDIDSQKATLIKDMRISGIHPDDLALINANLDQISFEQLAEISRFMTDSKVIADARWFDVSGYTNWDEYNFQRPIGETILGILARRDLFLDAARQLNNPALTNMSDEALAALAFSQAYVEEKWDQQPPWEDATNITFNWLHPDLLARPNLLKYLTGDSLYRLRVEYWWATYWPLPLSILHIGKGSDMQESLRGMRPPNANVPRLAGYAYPVGNQLYLQSAETVYWYADYLTYGPQRYGTFEPRPLDTGIIFPQNSDNLFSSPDEGTLEFAASPGLWGLLHAPFAASLRRELTHPETAAFWNVMRFVYVGARQREGGGSSVHPGNGQPAIMALQYTLRTPDPVGRPVANVSAFALLTTVYSDSILLDFINWNPNTQSLIVPPVDTERSDQTHRQVSERNKAIFVIEQMGSEAAYPNATHVSGSRGLGLALHPKYDDPQGDFLPYTLEEASLLVQALVAEAREYGVEDSRTTLCHSPLLKAGYDTYSHEISGVLSWNEAVGDLCQ